MEWTTFGTSVIGASHTNKQLPNQDAINHSDELPPFVAVADGHGGKKYIRSHKGSELAVQALESVLKESLHLHTNLPNLSEHIRHMKNRLLLHWQTTIDEHLANTPLTETEQNFLATHCSETERTGLDNNPRLAYGCTFLGVIAYEDMVLIIQHGDGDIVCLYPDSDLGVEIMEMDTRNFGGSTLSLGSLKDAADMSHKLLTAGDMPIPELIAISTDGIKNSYDDKDPDSIAQFYKIPAVIRHALAGGRELADILTDIESLLTRITANGSGDDVTLGILAQL